LVGDIVGSFNPDRFSKPVRINKWTAIFSGRTAKSLAGRRKTQQDEVILLRQNKPSEN